MKDKFAKLLLRMPLLHRLASKGVMLITYVGHISGNTFTVPVSYVYEEDNILLTTSFRHRTWWRSFRGGASVLLRLKGKDVPATAYSIENEADVAHYLTIVFDRFPKMAEYCSVTRDEDGEPDPDELMVAAAKRVIVRTRLED